MPIRRYINKYKQQNTVLSNLENLEKAGHNCYITLIHKSSVQSVRHAMSYFRRDTVLSFSLWLQSSGRAKCNGSSLYVGQDHWSE